MGEEQELKTFQDGEILFETGDPSGQLLIIEDGNVEIFRQKDSVHVTLSYMQKGEIIGLITCLTQKPRTASAKARGQVTVRLISTEKIKKTLTDVPQWIGIVIKEFSFRLNNLLDMVIDQKGQLESAQSTQVDVNYQALLISSMMSQLAPYHSIETERGHFVILEDLVQQVSECLLMEEERTKDIVEIIKNAGLLKIEKDPDKDRYLVPKDIMLALIDLAYFIRGCRSGINKKMTEHPFKDKSIRIARGMIMYAANTGLETNKEVKLNCGELGEKLEAKVGTQFQLDPLRDLDRLKMIKIDGEDITFIPNKLGRTIAHIIAVNKLKNFQLSPP